MARNPLKILVSNDDGILAHGLSVLADACRRVAEVTVVVPDREQSGASHSLTLHRPIRAERTPEGAYQVDGTPTDCVLLALGTRGRQGAADTRSRDHFGNPASSVSPVALRPRLATGLPFSVVRQTSHRPTRLLHHTGGPK